MVSLPFVKKGKEKREERENISESIEIFTKDVRKKWYFIIYSIPQRIIRR